MLLDIFNQNITLIMAGFFFSACLISVYLFGQERSIFIKTVKSIKKRTYVVLLLLIIGYILICGFFGFSFTSFQQTSHEWEALGFAKRIAEGDKLVFNNILHGLGYPVIIALGFKIFGINLVVSSIINLFLAVLSIFLVFLLSKIIWRKDSVGLVASFLYAMNPLVFSFTAYQMGEPTTIGFWLLLIAVVGTLAFREKRPGLHLLVLLLITLAAQTRLEYFILIVPYLITFVAKREYQYLKPMKFIVFIILFVFLSAPVFILNNKLKSSYESGWAGGTQSYYDNVEHVYSLPIADQLDLVLKPLTNNGFSFSFMIYDMPNFYYFWTSKYFIVILIFIFIGIVVSIKKKIIGHLFLLSFFLALSWIYLTASVFYESRFAIPSFALLVGYGAYALFVISERIKTFFSWQYTSLSTLLVLVLLVGSSPFWPIVQDRYPKFGGSKVILHDTYGNVLELVNNLDPSGSFLFTSVRKGKENMIVRLLGYSSDTLGEGHYLGQAYHRRQGSEQEYFESIDFPIDWNKKNYLMINRNSMHQFDWFFIKKYKLKLIKKNEDEELYLIEGLQGK